MSGKRTLAKMSFFGSIKPVVKLRKKTSAWEVNSDLKDLKLCSAYRAKIDKAFPVSFFKVIIRFFIKSTPHFDNPDDLSQSLFTFWTFEFWHMFSPCSGNNLQSIILHCDAFLNPLLMPLHTKRSQSEWYTLWWTSATMFIPLSASLKYGVHPKNDLIIIGYGYEYSPF